MKIMDIIAGMIIFAAVYILFAVTQPVMSAIIEYGHTQTIDPNAWSVIDFVQTLWDYAVIMAAGSGIAYIIYSSIREEVETRYAY